MFDGLASAFIDAIGEIMRPAGDLAEQRDQGEDSVRLAIAALLTHVAHVDGVLHDKETAALETMLAERFSLGETAARQLIASARRADGEANDFSAFASEVKRRLDAAGRARVIAMMWAVARADGEVHEFEEALIERVARLLAVDAGA